MNSNKEISKIIQGKFKFDTKKDIWDYQNILKTVSGFSIEQARKVEKILEANFGESRTQPEWEVIDKVEHIINERTHLFVGRCKETQALDNFLSENSSGVMLMTAEAGFGKTTLLANWLKSRQKNNCFIAYHFFSQGNGKTRSAKSAYRNLLRQLYDYYEIYHEQLPSQVDELRAALYNILKERGAREDKILVILIDALDELEDVDILFSVPFPTPLPNNVFVIGSARASEAEEPKYLENWIEQSRKLYLKRLPKIALAEWLKQTGKGELATFADDNNFITQLDEITEGFPLYLSYLTDELSYAAKQGNDIPRVWNLETGKEEFSIGNSDMVWSTTAIPKQELVIFGSQDGTISIWNVKTRQKEYSFQAHTNSVRAVCVTSDGERIISVSEDKTLKIWKVGSWENEATINAHTGSVLAVAVTSDGTKIISASGSTIYNLLSNDYTIKIWNLERCVKNRLFNFENSKTPHTNSVEVVDFTSDGKQVRSASKDGNLKFWKVGTWENEKTLIGNVNSVFTFGDKQNQKITKLKFGDIEETFHSIRSSLPFVLASSSNNHLQILSSGGESIQIWDASLRKKIAKFTGESEIRCCAIAPDKQIIVLGEASGRLHFLRLYLKEPL